MSIYILSNGMKLEFADGVPLSEMQSELQALKTKYGSEDNIAWSYCAWKYTGEGATQCYANVRTANGVTVQASDFGWKNAWPPGVFEKFAEQPASAPTTVANVGANPTGEKTGPTAAQDYAGAGLLVAATIAVIALLERVTRNVTARSAPQPAANMSYGTYAPPPPRQPKQEPPRTSIPPQPKARLEGSRTALPARDRNPSSASSPRLGGSGHGGFLPGRKG